MKRRIIVLLLAAVLVAMAAASNADENTQDTIIRMAQGLLTEVYGYTLEETDHFTYDISDEGDVWVVRFYQNPAWEYKAGIKKDGFSFTSSHTPFTTLYRSKAPENSVRGVLREMKTNEWLARWDADSRKALEEAIAWFSDIRVNTSLRRGLLTEEYTPEQALNDFFLSCYGDASQWSQALLEWRDAVFADFGLTPDTAAVSMPQDVVEYTTGDMGADGSTIFEFAGVVPELLAQAFTHPKLQGWTCLAGACQARSKAADAYSPSGTGLAAFGKGDQRLLVMLIQDAQTLAWKVLPISETALVQGRDLYIRYGNNVGRFDIVYPISDTETECFQCRLLMRSRDVAYPLMCGLEKYCRINTSDNSMVEIDAGTNYSIAGWYHVTTTKNGVSEEALYPAMSSCLMEYINASAFPRTEAECRTAAEASPTLPEGYGFSSNVHLRAKATSHSNDLGSYRLGTLVQVLDTQPGTDFPWYHVRIGLAEGYMSGNYVTYSKDQPSIMRYAALSVGKLKNSTALKQGTGLFAGTVTELPAGTIVRVLAANGNWLHVSVPQGEYGWLMQPGEIDGYIKSDTVVQGTTPLQLEWLQP